MKYQSLLQKMIFLVLGLLAIKFLSYPISAIIIEKLPLTPQEKVTAVAFPPEAGTSRYMVATDTPFAIVSEDAVGDFNVNIYVKGNINGNKFGANAQRPGPLKTCARQNSTKATKLYEAKRETAAREGEILTRAIIVEVKYDKTIVPKIEIISQKKARDLLSSTRCRSKLS